MIGMMSSAHTSIPWRTDLREPVHAHTECAKDLERLAHEIQKYRVETCAATDVFTTWSTSTQCVVAQQASSAPYHSVVVALQAMQVASLQTSLDGPAIFAAAALVHTYALEDQGRNRAAARELMLVLELGLRRNSLLEVNHVLAQADVSRLSSRSMIGLVRATARVRKLLPAWERTYRRSWQQIVSMGKSPEALFIGLPKLSEKDVAGATR